MSGFNKHLTLPFYSKCYPCNKYIFDEDLVLFDFLDRATKCFIIS